jgi:hypothetical protein
MTNDQVDDAVALWHVSCTKLPLHEFLGWTFDEYAAWMSDADCIPDRPLPPHRAASVDGRRMAETGTGSGRSPTSAVGATSAETPNPSLGIQHD